ncbi:MAG: hypothetical protein ACTMHL_10345, partial [Janibacter sp.]
VVNAVLGDGTVLIDAERGSIGTNLGPISSEVSSSGLSLGVDTHATSPTDRPGGVDDGSVPTGDVLAESDAPGAESEGSRRIGLVDAVQPAVERVVAPLAAEDALDVQALPGTLGEVVNAVLGDGTLLIDAERGSIATNLGPISSEVSPSGLSVSVDTHATIPTDGQGDDVSRPAGLVPTLLHSVVGELGVLADTVATLPGGPVVGGLLETIESDTQTIVDSVFPPVPAPSTDSGLPAVPKSPHTGEPEADTRSNVDSVVSHAGPDEISGTSSEPNVADVAASNELNVAAVAAGLAKSMTGQSPSQTQRMAAPEFVSPLGSEQDPVVDEAGAAGAVDPVSGSFLLDSGAPSMAPGGSGSIGGTSSGGGGAAAHFEDGLLLPMTVSEAISSAMRAVPSDLAASPDHSPD